MFGFRNMMGMYGNYEERKVDSYKREKLFISTALVTDGKHPFETAVEHPDYDNGNMIIVESYKTKKAAETGHKKWVKKMTSKKLPTKLIDCKNSAISQMFTEEELTFKRKSTK